MNSCLYTVLGVSFLLGSLASTHLGDSTDPLDPCGHDALCKSHVLGDSFGCSHAETTVGFDDAWLTCSEATRRHIVSAGHFKGYFGVVQRLNQTLIPSAEFTDSLLIRGTRVWGNKSTLAILAHGNTTATGRTAAVRSSICTEDVHAGVAILNKSFVIVDNRMLWSAAYLGSEPFMRAIHQQVWTRLEHAAARLRYDYFMIDTNHHQSPSEYIVRKLCDALGVIIDGAINGREPPKVWSIALARTDPTCSMSMYLWQAVVNGRFDIAQALARHVYNNISPLNMYDCVNYREHMWRLQTRADD